MKTIVQLVEEQKEYFLEKDTAAKQAVEANIAPVETDPSSASRAYVVGEQLFLNDVLYDVTSPISVGDAIAVGTNITAANKLSADIKSKIDDLYSKNQTLTNELDTTYLLAEQKTHSFAVSGATNAEILQNLAQHMLDFIQGLNDGVVIELLNLTIRGTGTTLIIPQKVLLTNAITDLSFNLFAMAGGSGTTYLYTGTVWASTLNSNKLSVCTLQDNQTPVTTNYDFTNATSFNFEMKHWKVVDLS